MLMESCARLGMPAMALLDRDGLYGSPRFYLAAKKAKIKAHIGAEVTFSQTYQDREKPDKRNSSVSPCLCGGCFRLPLLVASRAGYQNLCRLITHMKLRVGRKEGAIAEERDFIEHEGLMCL